MSMNKNLCVSDFGKICRTCLAEGEMKFLYQKCPEKDNLIEILMSITNVQFSEEDGLPVQICLNCESELGRVYKFAKKCSEADQILRKCFEEFKSKIKSAVPQNEIPEFVHIQIKTEFNIEDLNEVNVQQETILIKHEIPENEFHSETYENSNNFADEIVANPELLLLPESKNTHNEEDDDFLPESENKLNDIIPEEQILPEVNSTPSHECQKCLNTSGKYKLRCSHSKKVELTKVEICKICSKLITSTDMTKHMVIHNEENMSRCEFCGMTFTTKRLLVRHLKNHKCRFCEKSFIHAAALKEHMEIHTGDRPYVCEYCEKNFNVKKNWKIHMRIHTGEKPYKEEVVLGFLKDETEEITTESNGSLSSHRFLKKPGSSRLGRKYCRGCYRRKQKGEIPRSRISKVTTYCNDCAGRPIFCLTCFNAYHYRQS